MNIIEDTRSYETWLAQFCSLVASDLDYKHLQMARSDDPFPFFRGTYFRWARLWPQVCAELHDAPPILAIGDVHLENFGTWRDAEGRLCWGINDFDEVDVLPYTQDLVRLAASTHFARRAGLLDIHLVPASDAILRGYRESLELGGHPFVLEEHHERLRLMATAGDRDPKRFWEKLTALLRFPAVEPPASACKAMLSSIPKDVSLEYRVRPKAGVGSLGKPRFVALGLWQGGWICREAKAIAPPATAWLTGHNEVRPTGAVTAAIRSPDPFYCVGTEWVARRLGPHCSRIELAHLPTADVSRLLEAMGAEIANVHLGSGNAKAVSGDLAKRPKDWLPTAAKAMAERIEKDWIEWQAVK